MRVANDTIIPDGSPTLGGDWTSESLPLEHIAMFSIQLEFDGTPSGAFILECSNDDDNKEPTNWTLIEGSTQSISEAGDHTWNVEDSAFNWVRVRWIYSAGTGTLNSARFNAKGV